MNRDSFFGNLLLFVNKEWWHESAPINCTLPHINSLAHWRQVQRNYLFQDGYPRYHLICTPVLPPRGGYPSLVPSAPRTVGYGPRPWKQVWNLFQIGYPWYNLIFTHPRRAPSLGPYSPDILPCHPNFTHSQCCISKCSTVSSISDHTSKEGH